MAADTTQDEGCGRNIRGLFVLYIYLCIESKADNCALLFFADKVHIFCYDCV